MRTWFIGLGVIAKTGKDAVADALVETGEWQKFYMSNPLEKALLTINPWVFLDHDRDVNGPEFERYVDLHARVGYDESKTYEDVRNYLQKLGTEVGRNMFGEDCWLDYGMKTIAEARPTHNVALTGIRFENELQAVVTDPHGISIYCERPGYMPVNDHVSDNSLKAEDFDLVFENTGSLSDLQFIAIRVHQIFEQCPACSAHFVGYPFPHRDTAAQAV